MKRFIRLDEDGKVCSIRYGSCCLAGEVESEGGSLGEKRRVDGTFYLPEGAKEPVLPTFEMKVMENLAEITRTLNLLKEGITK